MGGSRKPPGTRGTDDLLDLRRIWNIASAIAVTWAALALMFAAGLHLCRLPWTKACYLTFWDGVAGLVLFRWSKDPSTIVAAGLALAAAMLGAYLLNRQIQQSDRHEADKVRRRFRAVRAATPLVLSEVCDYAEAQAKAWLLMSYRISRHPVASVIPERMGDDPPPGIEDVVFPSLSLTIVASLKEAVEAANDDVEAEPYMILLNDIQVLVARSRSFLGENSGDVRNLVNADEYCIGQVVEAAELYARAARLFEPTRVPDANQSLPIFYEEITSALYSMNMAYSDGGAAVVAARRFRRRGEEASAGIG